jgi:hypothetical protein
MSDDILKYEEILYSLFVQVELSEFCSMLFENHKYPRLIQVLSTASRVPSFNNLLKLNKIE